MKLPLFLFRLALVIACAPSQITCASAQTSPSGNARDPKQTIVDDTQILKDHPDDFQTYNDRGNAKFDLGDLDGAIADYNESIRINAHYVFAYNGRGNACSQKGGDDDLNQAVTDFSTAIRMNPKYAHAYNGRGIAELSQDGIQTAIDDFTQAITLNPNYAHAFYNRGVAECIANQFDSAVADLTKASELDPSNVDEWTYLWIALSHKDKAVANQKLKDYLNAYTFDPWSSAMIHFLLGDLPQDDLLKQALAAKDYRADQCEAYFLIGSKAEIAGDKVNAVDAYRHCLETDQKSYTDYAAAKAKIHLQDHPETSGVGQLPAIWVTGQIFIKDGLAMFKTDRPVKDNPLGNVVLIGSRLKPLQQIIAAFASKPTPPMLRLYGYFLQSHVTIPGHTAPLPNVEFQFWKFHTPEDPDVLPPDKRIIIDQDSTIQPDK